MSTFKKIISMLLCIAILISTLASCGRSDNLSNRLPVSTEIKNGESTSDHKHGEGSSTTAATEHVHVWSEWEVTLEATCTTDGEKSRSCVCGQRSIQIIDATGHNYTSVVIKPSCNDQGYTNHICVCGDTYKDNYVDAVGHDYNAVVTDPTCIERGFTTYLCTCGASYVTDYVDATGHSFGDWYTVSSATCTSSGTERRGCFKCNHYETKSSNPTQHTYTSIVTPPTCTERGYTTHRCNCGAYYVDTYVDAAGHSFGDWYTVSSATCTSNGTERRDCSKCTHYETNSLDPIKHTYTPVVTPPTCIERGYTTHRCNCGAYYVDTYVNATGHSFGNWYTVSSATCTSNGTERRDCSKCTHYETNTLDSAGHNYKVILVSPTCTEQGYMLYTCYCGAYYTENHTDATGHSFGNWYTVSSAACTSNGTERRDCSKCTYYETKILNATGHSYTSVVTPPTCTERGYTTYTCDCGASYIDNYITALSHTDNNGDATCDICGYISNVAGLYNADGKLIATWDALINTYGMDVEKDYGFYDFRNDYHSPYQVLQNNPSLSQGVKLIVGNVEGIGKYAFHHTKLVTIIIPNTVTLINSEAFQSCTKLVSLTIGTGVTKVSGFQYCDSLENITIASDNPVYRSENNCIIQKNDNVLITGCNNSEIPDGITQIASGAFLNRAGLTSITIPDSVTRIGDSAFSYCQNLTRVVIPDSVTRIDSHAFYNCMGLTSVVIGKGVTSLGSSVFGFCSSIESIEVAAENPVYRSENNCIIQKDNNALIIGCKNSEIPKGVTSIGSEAFYGSNITSVTIPDGVTTIASYAFASTALTSVTIPNSVTSIDNAAFAWSYSLINITFSGTKEQWNSISFGSGQDWNEGVPANKIVCSDGYIEFSHLYTSVVTPPTCTEGGYTTHTCDCGDSYIDSYVDATGHIYTAIITSPTCTKQGYTTHVCDCGDNYVDTYTAPQHTNIDNNSICDACGYLIPGLYDMTDKMLATWDQLVNTYGMDIEKDYTASSYQSDPANPRNIFSKYGSLSNATKLVLGEVNKIGAYTFYSYGIKTIVISDSVTEIGSHAFANAYGLKNITIGASVQVIGDYAFFSTGVTNVTIPDTVISIGEFAFHRCTSLTSVTIGNGVANMGSHTFAQCAKLTSITLGNGLEEIADHAFSDCTALTSVVIPGNVKTINSYAFYNCDYLVSVVIENGVTSIGDSAFQDSWNIESINIPDSVKYIGKYAFYLCSYMSTLIIGSGVETIGEDAFGSCVSLSEIFYVGSSDQWDEISVAASSFSGTNALIYFYSASAPTTEGLYWFYQENVPMIWEVHIHTEVIDIPVLPSCTKTGVTEGKHCSTCGEIIIAQIPIDALGHNTVSTVTPATCTANGYVHKACTRCEYETMEVIYATDHIITDYDTNIEPTCTVAGNYSGYCNACNEYITVEVSATGHTASPLYFQGDYCGQQALGYIICTTCEVTIAEFGHSYEKTIIQATCTETGKRVYTCSSCGDSYSETIAANGHITGGWTVVTPAGCTTEGKQGRYCIICDALMDSVAIAANGHSYESVTSTGGITYKCANCNDSYFVAALTYVTLTFICDNQKICDDLQIVKGTYPSLPIPTKNGYYFDGWYLDAEMTDKCLETYTFTSNTTLYGSLREERILESADTKNVITDVPLEYVFAVTSDVSLNNSNLSKYVFVKDLNDASPNLYIVSESDGAYTIGAENYTPGMTYQVLLHDGVTFKDVIGQEMWFMIEDNNKTLIDYKEGVIFISESSVYAGFEDDGKSYIMMQKDLLNVSDKAVVYGKDIYDVLLIMEVTAEGIFENLFVYQIDIPEFSSIFSEFDSYYAGTLDLQNMEFAEDLSERLTEHVISSPMYAQFTYAANRLRGVVIDKYYYDLNGFYVVPAVGIYENNIIISIEINAEFARMHIETREVESLFYIILEFRNQMSFSVNVQLSSIDNYSFIVKVNNATSINFFASANVDENGSPTKELSYFKFFYKDAQQSGEFTAIDENKASVSKELLLGQLPPLNIAGLTFTLQLTSEFKFDAAGKIGIGVEINTTNEIGIRCTPSQGITSIKSFKFDSRLSFYMLGKIEISDEIKLELKVTLLGIVSVYGNVAIEPYFLLAGALSASISPSSGIGSTSLGGYLEAGIKCHVNVGAEAKITWWWFGIHETTLYKVEWKLYEDKFILVAAGEENMPLYFNISEETLSIDYVCESPIYLATFINTSVVMQNLDDMITYNATQICTYSLNGNYQGVSLTKDGKLTVNATSHDKVITVKVSFGNVYKLVTITINFEHPPITSEYVAPTCTTNGNTAYTYCKSCNKILEGENTTLYAPGHNYSSTVIVPTCTEIGYTIHDCHCGDSYVDSYVQARGHNYVAVVTPPTCTERGYTTHTCSACNDFYIDTYVLASDHTDNGRGICSVCGSECDHVHSYTVQNTSSKHFVSDATCTSPQMYYYSCTCDATGSETFTVGNALGHTYTSVVTPPTCTSQGYTTYTCYCGASYVDSYVSIISHTDANEDNLCDTCGTTCLEPGLYDANGKRLSTWANLVNNTKMNVTTNYTSDNYKTSTTSPYYVLTSYSAFKNGVKLVIGDVSTIGNYAFYNCTMLTSIIIPKSVTSVGEYGFANCGGVKTVPNSLTTIGNRAFYGCKNLTEVSFNDNLTKIGSYAFYNCSQIVNVTFPAGLTSIGQYAFAGCSKITNITIPNSVTTISVAAFRSCQGLTSITLPNNLKNIGDYAFENCSKLTSIVIPDAVTSIGAGAFRNCSSLISIIVPNSVETIGTSVFSGCASLQAITLPFIGLSNSEHYDFDKRYLGYMFGAPDFTSNNDYVPASLKTVVVTGAAFIEDGAFYGCQNLQVVVLCDSVTGVGDQAFLDCTGLTNMIIPDSVTYLGTQAFYGCTNLKTVTLGTGIAMGNNVITVRGTPFSNCPQLTTITFTGTMAQWNSIYIQGKWLYKVATDKVHCTDGTVTII